MFQNIKNFLKKTKKTMQGCVASIAFIIQIGILGDL